MKTVIKEDSHLTYIDSETASDIRWPCFCFLIQTSSPEDGLLMGVSQPCRSQNTNVSGMLEW